MRTLWAITGKELRIQLTTWTSWVLVGGFLELTGFFFYLLVKDFQLRRLSYAENRALALLEQMNLTDLVVGPTFSYVASFFVFLLPVLTMRSFTEERRTKSLELMLSLPLRTWQLVLGKYLAVWLVMAVMVAATVVFPLSLERFVAQGEGLDWNTIGAGLLGMLLLGSAATAVGLCTSAVTESPLVAVVLAFGVLLILMVIGVAASGQSGATRAVLEYLSISHHLQGFARGLIRLPDVVYYLSLTVAGLGLALRWVEAERWR